MLSVFPKDPAEPMQVDVYYEENDNVGAGGVGSVENTTLVFNFFTSCLRISGPNL